jgi:uncharacterized protein YyaL (SSP411 family)
MKFVALPRESRERGRSDRALGALAADISRRPFGMTEALVALDYRTDRVREIGVVLPSPSKEGARAAAPLMAVIRRTFLPNKVLAVVAEGEPLAALAATAPFVGKKKALAGRATAYVCTRGSGELPTSDPRVLAGQLTQ